MIKTTILFFILTTVPILLSCSNMSDNKKDKLAILIGTGIDRAGKLTSVQKTVVSKEMTEFYEKVEEGCPCLVPEKETDPKYIIGKEEKAALDSYKNGIKADGLDKPDKRKERVEILQDKHFKAYAEAGIPAERYLMKMLAQKEKNNEICTVQILKALRNVTSAKIIEIDSAINENGKGLGPLYLEFLNAELKTFIQVRKSIIDELAKRK
ncbi:MAG: hypothetical protein MUD12_14215 [Spirochaetes bacterium]|jgi:hypothetical protein|nr:hypothetical protein [Spirochaetota bacterium]